jgi:hypothetical protein
MQGDSIRLQAFCRLDNTNRFHSNSDCVFRGRLYLLSHLDLDMVVAASAWLRGHVGGFNLTLARRPPFPNDL